MLMKTDDNLQQSSFSPPPPPSPPTEDEEAACPLSLFPYKLFRPLQVVSACHSLDVSPTCHPLEMGPGSYPLETRGSDQSEGVQGTRLLHVHMRANEDKQLY